jgi:transcriptional antiterminator NusG
MARFRIDLDKDWYVVRSNIKCEEKAAANLSAAGFDVYFPRQRVEVKHKRTNTILTKERPLMMRYLFVGLQRSNAPFGFVRACEGVESILGVNGTPVKVPATLVDSILMAEINLEFDDTREARIARKEEARTRKETIAMKFRKGLSVLIVDGPFASFLGEVAAVTSRGAVDILVEIFGRETLVEMEAGQIELMTLPAA